MSSDADIQEHDTGAPLAGRSVIVTRAADQARALTEPLEALGAEVLAFPVIATVEPPDWDPADQAIGQLGQYHWIVLTSANAVRCFFKRLEHHGLDAEAVAEPSFAVVGSATAKALRAYGIEPHLIPADFSAEGLIAEFEELGLGEGSHVLIPRAIEARELLPDTLRSWGATVDVAPVYQTVPGEPGPGVLERLRDEAVDAATFTSPSTFRNFRAMLQTAELDADATLRGMVLASIGPVTSEAIRASGHEVAVEPEKSTVKELAAALGAYYAAVDGGAR